MEIKRIQLRGISHNPSDRMTEDGGVAESLNAQIDGSEVAPVLVPNTIDIGIPAGTTHDRIFIHKVLKEELYIAIDEGRVGYYKNKSYNSIFNPTSRIVDVTSVGNTLLFTTEGGIEYVLFKEGEYKYLGSTIPRLHMRFECEQVSEATRAEIDVRSLTDIENIWRFNEDTWNLAAKDVISGISNSNASAVKKINDALWGAIKIKTAELRRDKILAFPRFVRYALRLFDGSYIYQSIPYLLGAGNESFFSVGSKVTLYDSGNKDESVMTATLSGGFRAKGYFASVIPSDWRDIVMSLDVFVSTEVCYPLINSNFDRVQFNRQSMFEGRGVYYYDAYFSNGGLSDHLALEQELLGKTNFYEVASFAPGEVTLMSELDLGETLSTLSQDDLVTKKRVPDQEQTYDYLVPSKVFTINNRIFAIGNKRGVQTGYRGLQSLNILKGATSEEDLNRYNFAYFLNGSNGESIKVIPPVSMGSYEINERYAKPYGFICFPDPRCYKVEIFNNTTKQVYSVAMKPHPGLNCAYAYWGLSKTIEDLENPSTTTLEEFHAGSKHEENDSQRLYQSSVNNPFYFPTVGNKTLQGNVYGVATASTALSQGQFGQYPLYAFTSEGIFAMEVNATGDIISVVPLSRDVCTNPESITSLENAVVFVTDKGLMHLSGSQVTNLSPNMNGKAYAVDGSAKVIIAGQEGYKDYDEVLDVNIPFLAFLKKATIAYDYAGRRIVCMAPDEDYQYIYKTDSQTWHKTAHSARFISPINSYPECLVLSSNETSSVIYDLSTHYDASKEQQTEKILIATRPFDLGEPDILKTVTDVRVRGQFSRGAVKFILQGSQDNIHWYTISTLRGKSWKLFRIILLADLEPTDRISWIDVGYEKRFTNKLR